MLYACAEIRDESERLKQAMTMSNKQHGLEGSGTIERSFLADGSRIVAIEPMKNTVEPRSVVHRAASRREAS